MGSTVTLTCGHPAVVTHDRGDMRVYCAVPKCGGVDAVLATPQTTVTYTTRSLLPPAAELEERVEAER